MVGVVNISENTYERDISLLTQEDFKYLLFDTNTQMAKVKKGIKTVLFYPSGHSCDANCFYCYVNSNILKNHKDFLTPQEIYKSINDIGIYNEKYNTKLENIKFTGGEPLLNPKIFEIIDTIMSSQYNLLSIYTSLIIKEKVYNKLLDRLRIWNPKKIQLYLSADFGSDVRGDVGKRIKNLCEYVSRKKLFNKVKIKIHSVITKKTNIDQFFRDVDYFIGKYNDFVEISFYPVRQKQYEINRDVFEHMMNRAFENYDIHLNELTNICLNKNSGFCEHEILYEKISDDVYIYSPFNYHCSMFKNALTVHKNGFDSCFFIKQYSQNIEDATVLNEERSIDKFFSTLPDFCKKCDYVSICSKCRIDRHNLGCTDIDKIYEQYRWKVFQKYIRNLHDNQCIKKN